MSAREDIFRNELMQRRVRLKSAMREFEDSSRLSQLLEQVDSALNRLRAGTFGICEECHEPVEEERLLADPLVRLCLDHLTTDQQRALEQDLELASRVQAQLLPKRSLQFDGWEACYHFEPAGAVSGDYCDVVESPGDGAFCFFVGDISGKGVAASMLMTHLHAIFRSLSSTGMAFKQLLERANRLFCETTMSAQYATLVSGRADKSGLLELANAGHCRPLLFQRGKVTEIESTGLPIGLFCDGEYGTQTFRFLPGDTLVIYTDGLTEARDQSDTEYGSQRLASVLRSRDIWTAAQLMNACLEDHQRFLNGLRKSDDMMLMVVQKRM